MAKIAGRKRLLAKMKALPGAVRSAIKQAIAEGADEITDMQRRLAQSKRIANSIEQRWGDKPSGLPSGALTDGSSVAGDPDLSVWITAGNSEAFWARWEEFGTAPHPQGGMFEGTMHPGTPARPFFYPPVRALRRRVRSRISRATNKAAKKVAGSK